jgi:hypothetical protein
MSTTDRPSHQETHPSHDFGGDDSIDLRDLFGRLSRGTPQITGLALIGLIFACLISLSLNRVQPVATSTRVVFSFPGFERGEYPDRSKFQPDDLRAPAVVAEAIRRQRLDTSVEFQSKIRGAIGIEGIVPPNIVKERDRLRAAGQTPPPYTPDEYQVTLTLPRSTSLSDKQRNQLLNEVVTVYRENFNRTYSNVPLAFGSAFATLHNADFPEYQLILDNEIEGLTSYLEQLVARTDSKTTEGAGSFRSVTTNLSFKDLLEQTQLFAQIRLNETLGLIHQNGLSKDRSTALVKMNYYLRVLENQERRAVEENKVVTGLLAQSQERAQNYVLGVKSQATQPRNDAPILDQGLIDSLLANDAYNFLVRRALDAGLQVKRIQAEKARLQELRENMSSFVTKNVGDQAQIFSQVSESLKDLESAYNQLVKNIRDTYADFARQQYGSAVRLSDQIRTPGMLKPMAIAAVVGAFLGFALGAGLSLLGIYIGKRSESAHVPTS